MKILEFAVWNLKIQNKVQLMDAYHPPPSKMYQQTDQMFIDEFLELYMEISVKYTNQMTRGNFNVIHYFNKENDSLQFKDMIEAISLKQLVSFPTHTLGNVLDLILIEQIGSLEVNSVIPSLSFSDHISIIWELKFKRPKVEQMVKSFRNWKKVDIEEFWNDLHLEDLDYTLSYLNDFLQAYQRWLVDGTNEKVPNEKE